MNYIVIGDKLSPEQQKLFIIGESITPYKKSIECINLLKKEIEKLAINIIKDAIKQDAIIIINGEIHPALLGRIIANANDLTYVWTWYKNQFIAY